MPYRLADEVSSPQGTHHGVSSKGGRSVRPPAISAFNQSQVDGPTSGLLPRHRNSSGGSGVDDLEDGVVSRNIRKVGDRRAT